MIAPAVAWTSMARPSEPILHVDLDAFYASVEVLKDPSLRGKPVIVGGTGSRGVVTSASYEARRSGVHSAMPSVRARRLCPEGIFLPPDFEAYRVHSNRFREVMLSFTPLVEPISLDEAFLDVGGATRLFGEPPEIAGKIRDAVLQGVGVTCSAGVASTKFVAKLASAHCKPDGLLHVPATQTIGFLEPLPVGRLWGVGEKTADLLGRLAIRTIGDLARTPEQVLQRLVGEAAARHLTQLAHGLDEREVIPYEAPKSIGHEETFDRDLDDVGRARSETRRMSAPICTRLPASSIGRSPGRDAASVCWACRRAVSCGPARSSSRCSAPAAGTTWSGRSIGSSGGSAEARRPTRPCSTGIAGGRGLPRPPAIPPWIQGSALPESLPIIGDGGRIPHDRRSRDATQRSRTAHPRRDRATPR